MVTANPRLAVDLTGVALQNPLIPANTNETGGGKIIDAIRNS